MILKEYSENYLIGLGISKQEAERIAMLAHELDSGYIYESDWESDLPDIPDSVLNIKKLSLLTVAIEEITNDKDIVDTLAVALAELLPKVGISVESKEE